MKSNRILYISLLFLLSCENQNQIKNTTNEKVDTLISTSERNFNTIQQVDKKSDTLINKKVTYVVKKINNLENSLSQLKTENNELKTIVIDTGGVRLPYILLPISSN